MVNERLRASAVFYERGAAATRSSTMKRTPRPGRAGDAEKGGGGRGREVGGRTDARVLWVELVAAELGERGDGLLDLYI